jgi:acyl carrier protein
MIEEVLVRMAQVVRDVLDLDELQLTETMSAKDVDGWDSLAHIRILIAIEAEFGVRFETSEMAALPTVGAFAELILRKTS